MKSFEWCAAYVTHARGRENERKRTICKLKNLMPAHKKNLSHKEWYRLIINYFKLNTYIHMQQQQQRYQRKKSWQRRIRKMLRKVLALIRDKHKRCSMFCHVEFFLITHFVQAIDRILASLKWTDLISILHSFTFLLDRMVSQHT